MRGPAFEARRLCTRGNRYHRNRTTKLLEAQPASATDVGPLTSGDPKMHIYNRTALAQATADFIRQRANWEFYVSLSYVNEVRAPLAARHFQRFLRSVAKRYGTHVDVAWGEEEQERGAYHHHALLAQRRIESRFETPKVTTHDLDTLWRFTHSSTGHARVVRYKPWRGAAYYMARHQNWDINVACPRRPACRRTRCIVAPSAW